MVPAQLLGYSLKNLKIQRISLAQLGSGVRQIWVQNLSLPLNVG